MLGGSIAPGEYQVFGGVLDAARPAYVDYGFANALGDFTNGGGRIGIECGDILVDQIVYLEAGDGVSQGFDGSRVPDAVANDALTSWCAATSSFETGAFGTPGAPNDACAPVSPPGTCTEGGTSRDVVPPVAGAVVISEIMADPSAVGDTAGEWIELYFSQDADLNGLQLGEVPGTVMHMVADATCLPVSAGAYVLIARNADPLVNGGLPTVNAVWPNLAMSNTGGTIYVGYDGAVLDSVTYTDAMISAGRSTGLDPARLSAVENDDPAYWCDGSTVYGSGTDKGTPGAANPSCGTVVPPDSCVDPETLATRDLVAPVAGDVVITELMADPSAVGDTAGEWLEIYFAQAADLNGLQLGEVPGTVQFTVSSAECVSVVAGTHVLVAKNGDPLVNGGLPPAQVVWPGMSFSNTGGGVFVGYAGEVLDAVSYTDPMVTAGKATSLDPALRTPADNDLATSWCNATTVYGGGSDTGTPGAENPSCGTVVPPDSCVDPVSQQARDLVAPEAGDVVITEFMADPAAVADTAGEWLEIYFAQAADLNGLQLGKTPGTVQFTVSSASCVPVAAGTHVLVARNGDPLVNGGLPAVTVVWPGLSLSNTGGSLFVGYADAVLDAITYTDPMVNAGKATSLDSGHLTPTDNDVAANWCNATATYGAGSDTGTPGAANPSCGAVVPPNTCLDGGNSRAIVPPGLGDVIITEVMADPAAVADTAGEWFEVYFAAAADLNGLQLGDASNPTANEITSADCLHVAAGSYVVFAVNANPAQNGGLPAVAYAFTFGLNNTNETITVGHGGVVLDTISYATSIAGTARSLSSTALDPTQNDLATSWCAATATYGTGTDKGSPGAANPACP
jgi:hypothetical protein